MMRSKMLTANEAKAIGYALGVYQPAYNDALDRGQLSSLREYFLSLSSVITHDEAATAEHKKHLELDPGQFQE